jgi:hypothetical protein
VRRPVSRAPPLPAEGLWAGLADPIGGRYVRADSDPGSRPVGYEPLPDRRTNSDRRELDDRRAGVDRRFGPERRRVSVVVDVERRAAANRRAGVERRRAVRRSGAQRRVLPDRRRSAQPARLG